MSRFLAGLLVGLVIAEPVWAGVAWALIRWDAR